MLARGCLGSTKWTRGNPVGGLGVNFGGGVDVGASGMGWWVFIGGVVSELSLFTILRGVRGGVLTWVALGWGTPRTYSSYSSLGAFQVGAQRRASLVWWVGSSWWFLSLFIGFSVFSGRSRVLGGCVLRG